MAVRTSIVETTTAPVENARHHNRKRKAAESSGRKSARNRATQRRVKPYGLVLLLLGLTIVELKLKYREVV